jgi:hypothetical protein
LPLKLILIVLTIIRFKWFALRAPKQSKMAFSNQVISDQELERYSLPFPRGSTHTWTRDVERDYYLWGGLHGHPIIDGWQEGVFSLFVDGLEYGICLEPGFQGTDPNTGQVVVGWSRVLSVTPEPSFDDAERIQSILREALSVYGLDGGPGTPANVRVDVDF